MKSYPTREALLSDHVVIDCNFVQLDRANEFRRLMRLKNLEHQKRMNAHKKRKKRKK